MFLSIASSALVNGTDIVKVNQIASSISGTVGWENSDPGCNHMGIWAMRKLLAGNLSESNKLGSG